MPPPDPAALPPEESKSIGRPPKLLILRISVLTVVLVLLLWAFLAHESDLTKATLKMTVYPEDGSGALPVGTNVELLSQDGSNAHIRYAGREYIVPSSMVSQSK